MQNTRQTLRLMLWLGVVLICAFACRSFKSEAGDIAGSMKDRLEEDLRGKLAQRIEGMSVPDHDDAFDPACCVPDDPCFLANDGLCQCEDMEWDALDCALEFDTLPLKRLATDFVGAVCTSNLPACQATSEALTPTDGMVMDEIELGWKDGEPPPSDFGPESLLCFADPYVVTDPHELVLLFGFGSNWDYVAALVLVIEGLPGYGLLPVDACGSVVLPGLEVLCAGSTAPFSLALQAAMHTYAGETGPYLSFSLSGDCANLRAD